MELITHVMELITHGRHNIIDGGGGMQLQYAANDMLKIVTT